MNDTAKNIREWVILLFALFCVMDIAALQYGIKLTGNSATRANPVGGQIVEMMRASQGGFAHLSATGRDVVIFYGFLGGAAIALFATLGLLVAHGMRRAWVGSRSRGPSERPAKPSHREGEDRP